MKKANLKYLTGTFILLFCVLNISAQEQKAEINDSLLFKGQFSAWTHFNGNNTLPLWSGARYIPQINYEIKNTKAQLVLS
jgi:hypothetical protein